MNEYETLLVEAYKGELFGEALFGAFADREADTQRSEKFRVLERIEGNTASQLRPLIDAAGVNVSADDEAAARAQGTELADAGIDWDGFVKGLHDALPPFLSNFVRLRTLAPDPSDPALVALVTHEQAINAFAELELAGNSDRSIAVLQWHLETVAS
jgi:hypothetical protein